ncbi:hypothetical protein BST61_g8277 [Cercospora zeina]
MLASSPSFHKLCIRFWSRCMQARTHELPSPNPSFPSLPSSVLHPPAVDTSLGVMSNGATAAMLWHDYHVHAPSWSSSM